MKLHRWRGEVPNFGDELNLLLWPRLLPDFFDDQPGARFLGIGSVLDGRHPGNELKIVAGAGYGGYEKPARIDRSWLIHWVRGPRTAQVYGLPRELALGDPASLIPHVIDADPVRERAIGFMPHFESAGWGNWAEATTAAGIHLIDPRGEPAAIIREITACRLFISEALHGVITADALRVPWIGIRPRNAVHRAKWRDWADSLSLRLHLRRLPASSLMEQASASMLAAWRPGRRFLDRHEAFLRRQQAARFVARAAAGLLAAASHDAQLSGSSALERSQQRMMERVQVLRRGVLFPLSQPPEIRAGVRPGSNLHLRRFWDSAYHPH